MGAVQPEPTTALPYIQHKYGDHDLQRFGVWERPIHATLERSSYWIVFLHGGAWRDPRNTFRDLIPCVEYMSSSSEKDLVFLRGFISIDHRLSPHPDFPQQEDTPAQSMRMAAHPDHIHDVHMAINLAQQLYGIKNDYIFIGHSSGATLGYQLLMGGAVTPNLALPCSVHLPAAIIGIYGIYDLLGLNSRYGGQYSSFLAGAFGADTDVWRQVSPSQFDGDLKAGCAAEPSRNGPVIAILADSKDDKLLDYAEVETMKRRLMIDGIDVVVVDNLVGGHDFIWQDASQLSALIYQCIKTLRSSVIN